MLKLIYICYKLAVTVDYCFSMESNISIKTVVVRSENDVMESTVEAPKNLVNSSGTLERLI